MELEMMKTMWEEMSAQVEKQKTITDSLIMKMTESGYKSKTGKIIVPEIIGSLGCIAISVVVLINFQKFNTWYLMACSITTVLILLVLAFMSIKSVNGLRSVNISKNNYRQMLLQYSKAKAQVVFVQKLSFYLSAILLLTVLPVMGKLIAGKDFFKETNLWMFYAISFIFFYPFFKWVFKSYKKIMADAENVLKELEG